MRKAKKISVGKSQGTNLEMSPGATSNDAYNKSNQNNEQYLNSQNTNNISTRRQQLTMDEREQQFQFSI
jgi:hypothetical protein